MYSSALIASMNIVRVLSPFYEAIYDHYFKKNLGLEEWIKV